jgi:hypothetical protein
LQRYSEAGPDLGELKLSEESKEVHDKAGLVACTAVEYS